ncbi:hypothetical protein M011DRAFT_467195 [Sporormia fimetaria CBS 119925]|uniref:Uncharacterized protein n=1 Tax=Sporormia fimetaria CBS 119925 TaxID=1340428 RepID=A0A6A6VG34_9PLEO|nr:hypothetical protein M011DRAFT_467195 [Sporormia fimetaria CBS 119925]
MPRVDPIDPKLDSEHPLGSVHWQPTGNTSGLHLYCHTICDLLGACMSEAAHLYPRDAESKMRTKRNYYARLVALFSHWCVRITSENRRPMKVGIAVFQDMVVLGSCIPDVPEWGDAKEVVRKARLADLKKRGRWEAGKRQVLEVKKVDSMLWDYGNCAETWSFALLCML